MIHFRESFANQRAHLQSIDLAHYIYIPHMSILSTIRDALIAHGSFQPCALEPYMCQHAVHF